jgi:hypothetical protein
LIKQPFAFFLIGATAFTVPNGASADIWAYQARGYLFGRLSTYTDPAPKDYGQQTRVQFAQSMDFSKNFSALSQLRWTSNSLSTDLNTKQQVLAKKETFEIFLGENYFKYKAENWVAQIGYQEVVWGEAFGFNYADIISPKDQRETLYSDAADARLPLLLFNEKTFFSIGDLSGSLQLLFSPEPRFSKTLPIELYTGKLLTNFTINVNKEKTPALFKNKEYGGKLAGSYGGYDVSAFSFTYLDRSPHYVFESATINTLTIKENHNKISSQGMSLAKSVYDFVFRTDLVLTNNKMINYVDSGILKTLTTSQFEALVSLDSPTFHDYSGVLIFAQSNLKDIMMNSFREKQEQYIIGKLSKNLGEDRTFEFSYTHEFAHSGHSLQSFINWPVNSTNDIKLGGQFYFGDEQSNLNKYKKISSIFISLKNYFQL